MTRIRYDSAVREGLANAIRDAEVVALYDVDFEKQQWVWNKRSARMVAVGAPAHKLDVLEIGVSTEKLSELKSLVTGIKDGPASG